MKKRFTALITSIMFLLNFIGYIPIENSSTTISAETIKIDSNFTCNDILLLKKSILGVTEVDTLKYDINQNNKVDILDLLEIKSKVLNSTINDEDRQIIQTEKESIILDGIQVNENLVEISCEWYSESNSTSKTYNVTYDSLGNWQTEEISLDIGSNYVTITFTYDDGSIEMEEYLIQRLSTEIYLDDDLKIVEDEDIQSTYDEIIDVWTDDKQTEDTLDDELCLLVTENNPILQNINNGEIAEDNIIYIPACELFPSGLSLIYISQDNDYDTSLYGNDSYIVLHTQQASMLDILDDDQDVFIDYESVDVDNITWIPYEYDDDAINEYFNSLNLNTEVVDEVSNINSFSLVSDSDTSGDLKKGWNLSAFARTLKVEHGYTDNPSDKLEDKIKKLYISVTNSAVLYDGDGNAKTTNDQLTLSFSFKLNNIKPQMVLENQKIIGYDTHIPKQYMCSLEYDKSIDATFGGKANLNLADLFKDDSIVSLSKPNKLEVAGYEITGIDMSNKFVLGLIRLNLLNPAMPVGNKTFCKGNEVATKDPSLFVMVYLDMSGNISAEYTIGYSYKATEKIGFNFQDINYKGKYGTYQSLKSTNPDHNTVQKFSIGNIADVGYGLSYYNDKNVKTSKFTGKVSATLQSSIGLYVGIGFSAFGLVPVMGSVGVKAYEKATGSASIVYDMMENSFEESSINGCISANVDLDTNVQFKLTAKKSSGNLNEVFSVNWQRPVNFHLLSLGMMTVDGTVVSSKDDTPIPNAIVTFKNDYNTFTATTDKDGKFFLNPPYCYIATFTSSADNMCEVSISADGFKSYSENYYNINPTKTYTNLQFALTPDGTSTNTEVTTSPTEDDNNNDNTEVTTTPTTDDDDTKVTTNPTTTENDTEVTTTTTTEEKYILYGDVNGDDKVIINDFMLMKGYLLNPNAEISIDLDNADCYSDGIIDARDALVIKMYILHLRNELHIDNKSKELSNGEDCTFSIDNIKIQSLDELEKTSNGNYIVPVSIHFNNNTDCYINAIQLSLDTELEIYPYPKNFDYYYGYYENQFGVSISTETNNILYAGPYSMCDTFEIYVIMPTNVTNGDTYDINFNANYNNICFDSNYDYFTPQLINGSITIL